MVTKSGYQNVTPKQFANVFPLTQWESILFILWRLKKGAN